MKEVREGQRLRDKRGATFRVGATHHALPAYTGSMGSSSFHTKRVLLVRESSGTKWSVPRSPWPPHGWELLDD